MASGQLRFPTADDPPAAERLEQDAAGFGFFVVGDDAPVEDEFYLWPESCGIWELWLSVQTQWHTDNGVRTRLDYTGVQVVMNNHPIGKNRLTYFKTLQAMEFSALDEWAKQR